MIRSDLDSLRQNNVSVTAERDHLQLQLASCRERFQQLAYALSGSLQLPPGLTRALKQEETQSREKGDGVAAVVETGDKGTGGKEKAGSNSGAEIGGTFDVTLIHLRDVREFLQDCLELVHLRSNATIIVCAVPISYDEMCRLFVHMPLTAMLYPM